MKILWINTPSNLIDTPFSWLHDLTLEIANVEQYGHTLGLVDNAMHRLDIEVLKDHCNRVEPDKTILYGGLDQYRFIKEYLPFFEDAVVQGFPKDILPDLPIEDGIIPPEEPDELPNPAWAFLPLEDYFANSALPFSIDTATSTRRAVFKSRWGEKVQSPEKVAETLRYLKLAFNYDFIVFDEDFTLNKKRTYKLLKKLNEFDLTGLFKWSCQADPAKVDRNFIDEIREAGCRIIEYKEFDVTKTNEARFMSRLETAIHTTKKLQIAPIVTSTIGFPNTEKEDLERLLILLKGSDPFQRISIAKPYPGTDLFEEVKNQIEDMEAHILAINESFVNFTKWTDAELLGIVALMARRDIERIEAL